MPFSKPLKGDDIAKCMADNQEPNADAPKAGELPKNQEKNNNQPEGIHI